MLILGHRGGRGEGWPPENSLAAFARALAEGADGVELDVRLCASGELVLVHDPRLADGRAVARVSRAELGDVADLGAALDLCQGRLVNVEVKPDVPNRLALVRAVRRELRRSRAHDVVVSSFDPAIVLGFGLTGLARGMLVGPRTPWLKTALPLALRRGVVSAHLHDSLLTERTIGRLHAAGLRVAAWTINDAARAAQLRELGVWALITDTPGAIRAPA